MVNEKDNEIQKWGGNLTYMLKLIVENFFMDRQNLLKTQKKCPNTRSNPSPITPESL
jgi:hypothetical protein